MTVEADINKLWEDGVEHDPRSEEIVRGMASIDEMNGRDMDIKFGGDGDLGEHMMYLLDVYFRQRDANLNMGRIADGAVSDCSPR